MTARNLWQDQERSFAPFQPEPNPQPRILVVDDEPIIRLLTSRALTLAGYHVDTAEDGDAAWHILNADFTYDLLVTDNNMPKVSGLELIKKLHAARLSLPVILASGMMPTEELHWHPWLRIDAKLVKPFSTGELLETVENLLRPSDDSPGQMESSARRVTVAALR